jgi:hypothetical protein
MGIGLIPSLEFEDSIDALLGGRVEILVGVRSVGFFEAVEFPDDHLHTYNSRTMRRNA